MNKSNPQAFANPICQKCIREHLEKYAGYVDEDGIKYDEFCVTCSGIPLQYLDEKLRAALPEEAQKQAIELFDPVSWAAEWCKLPDGSPWIAYWYQENMLRCSCKRRVTRNGRRSGKTDTLAVYILHNAFTNKNRRILVIAPYKAHVEEVIGRIRGFISSNKKLQMSVVRDVSSPFYEIKFRNGSRIRAFSSGTKSGGEGVAIRGQDADLVITDEADYLDPKDLRAITAILATNPRVELWASSTPSGRRAHFWRWCLQSPTYKEFHYPTPVVPTWDQMKDQIKADYAGDRDGWTREILAEFGEEVVGLFQHQYTEASLVSYKYETQTRVPEWTYILGIDWNSNFGTEIVCVGYNGHGKFRIVDALNIPKQGWTQLAGLETVIEMNAKWLPVYIYADDGAGRTNLELLQKYGHDMVRVNKKDPAVKLKDIVKGYNFSSKIDTCAPITRKPIKKHAKPFMVENTVRFFEEGRIEISEFDTVLRKQLENYIIKHRTTAGVPVYGLRDERVGDHRLDAVMLALVGFKLEMSDFGPAPTSTTIGISPGFAQYNSEPGMQNNSAKEMANRLNRMPQSRKMAHTTNQPIIGSGAASLPAYVEGSWEVPEYRYGFMTDEEEKYRAMYRLRNKRNQSRTQRDRPSRSNI